MLWVLFIAFVSAADVMCCYHGYHYHECWESIKSDGCVIGSSIGARVDFVATSTTVTSAQPYFIICSNTTECHPTELGGVFLRGFRKNCPECFGQPRLLK